MMLTKQICKMGVATTLAFGASLLGATHAAFATPPAVSFPPPKVDVGKICVAKRSDDDIIGEWSDWNGKTLPKGKTLEVISRELVKLRETDAVAHFDRVNSALSLMRSSFPSYKETRYLVDVISLYIKAGRFADLAKMGYIKQLEKTDFNATPKSLNFLADLHLSGHVEGGSEEEGLNLKLRAAYGGDPDALLYLAKLVHEGQQIEGWDVVPEIAVTLAFGSMLGKLNPTICDRITKIARIYANGDVVARDYELSESWFRFGAELGDAFAAWKVAEYHLTSEFIVKDNDTLVSHIKQASDGGIVTAQLEYARMLEMGALVKEDLEQAMQIYEKVAQTNLRAGLLRKLKLLERMGNIKGKDEEEYISLIRQLAKLKDAPAWAFTKLGYLELEKKGRWKGLAAARGYFQKGADAGDMQAQNQLALLELEENKASDGVLPALDRLYANISNSGDIDALLGLSKVHRCSTASYANNNVGSYWREAELAAGNKSLLLSHKAIEKSALAEDHFTRAKLQTTALFGRAKAIGNFAEFLEHSKSNAGKAPDGEDTQAVIDFWHGISLNYKGAPAAFEAGLYSAAKDPDRRADVVSNLKDMAESGDSHAAKQLANILLFEQSSKPEILAETASLIFESAGTISGDLLIKLDQALVKSAGDGLTLNRQQIERIVASGDTTALLFLAAKTENAEQKQLYRYMAQQVMKCNFDTVLEVIEHLDAEGAQDEQRRWLEVGNRLMTKPWEMVKVADFYAKRKEPEALDLAYGLYRTAFEKGSSLASLRLLDFVADPKLKHYDAQMAKRVFAQAFKTTEPQLIYGILSRAKKAPAEIQEALAQTHDMEHLYRQSAEQDRPIAMRELARLLRSGETTADRVAEAVMWLEKAAEAGDVVSMSMLAETYAFGIGVKPSPKKAQKWLVAASEAGDDKAKSLLAIFFNATKEK